MLKQIKIFCYKFFESLNKITLIHITVIKVIELIKEIVSNCKNNFNNNFNCFILIIYPKIMNAMK